MAHSKLPPGVVQGPDGKFQSADDVAAMFDDLEYHTFTQHWNTPQGNVDGTTSTDLYGEDAQVEGETLLNIEKIVDRHEVAHLLYADVALRAFFVGKTATGGNQLRAAVEISASPSLSAVDELDNLGSPEGDESGDVTVQLQTFETDSADLVMRPLMAAAASQTNDDTNGNASGPMYGYDDAEGPVPGNWDFDRRDDLFTNVVFEYDNVSDITAKVELNGQLLFGITED